MYFSADYFTARTRFRTAVEAARGRLESLGLDARGPRGEALGIDIGLFGAERPRRVLLHSSGLHGVEGFAGSAIQLQFLDAIPALPADAALIVVHILNPFGMAWLRRVNEDNIDLNRNFLTDGSYAGAPKHYAAVDLFLNPQSPPGHDFFFLKAQQLIFRYGMMALKQAIAGGQYEFPRGLFFGGKRLAQGAAKYKGFLEKSLASAQRVEAIDIHTGLGKYGRDTLLVDPGPTDEIAYAVRGSVHSMITAAAPKAKVNCVCQEFGTFHQIKVLRALREENRWHHYGKGTPEHATKRRLKEMFCPDDDGWRKSVLERGDALLQMTKKKLNT
jgi:hypothetical protein